MSSPSSTEDEALRIGGFRVEREIRRSGTTVIYEATQVDLERRVALTVLSPDDPRAKRFQAAAWPEHRHVLRLFAAGESEHGFHIATRFVPGATTLAQRIAAGDDATRWLDDVRDALDSTDAVHGALGEEESLLIDGGGEVLIAGFGLGPDDATRADDERSLAALERSAATRSRPERIPLPRRVSARVAGAVAAAVALALIAVAAPDDATSPDPAPPAVARGMVALGSALAAGPVRTVDCEGDPPSGASPSCTATQTALPGRVLVASRDGTVRRWHVRGARGEVAMRVIRRRGAKFIVAGGSGYERVDGGVRSFRAAVPIRAGDLVALELGPGSGAGFRESVAGAATTRFLSALSPVPRAPNPPPGLGRSEEILLRVDYEPGSLSAPDPVTGAAAAAAADGRRLDERVVDLAGGGTVTVAAVSLGDRVVVDVFRGGRRRARVEVPGADPGGRLVALTLIGAPTPTLVWRNPDGGRIESRYQVTATSIELVG
jgi:hypothetical protein